MKHPLLLLLIASSLAFAQPFQQGFKKDFSPNFFEYFLSNGQKDFYLSQDGSRIFMITDLKYQVIDGASGELITEGKQISKVNAVSASMFGILRNRSFNRADAIDKVRFDEGTEYMVFPEENLVLVLDWNVKQNVIKAIDLETGKELWSVDRYRYSSPSKTQFVDLVLGMANVGRLQRRTPREVAVRNALLQGYGEGAISSSDASLAAYGFITPMEGTGLCLFRVGNEYIGLDLKTGEEKWKYNKRKLYIGFAQMTSDKKLVIVNFNSSYFQGNERLILKLDPMTGEEIWTTNHLSDFREARTYMTQDRLICDYYGAEVFDLSTGKRLFLSIDEKTVKTQNTMTAMFNSGAGGTRGTQSIASPSFLEGDYLYTSTFKLGPRLYANDGSSKAMVQKYDIKTGKQLWQSDKLSKGTDLSFASSDFVFVRKGKAFGKSALFVLDAKTGKLLTETETIDGFVYREGAGDVLTPSFLYRGGKKNVYAFSTQSWKMVKTYNTKSEKAGKLQVMIPASSQLLTVGDKGLIFFDGQGKSENAVNTPRVTGTYWNDTYCFLFTTKKTVAVNLDTQEMAGELSLFPTENTFFLFSADGSKMVTIQNGNSLVLFNN